MTTNTKRGKYPEHFLPGAEELSSDEIRITALGTGRPFLRRSQANSCWLIELGMATSLCLILALVRK